MTLDWDQLQARLDAAAAILNREEPVTVSGPLSVGVDLGTADVVLMVLDASGEPVAAFLEWAEVVRDGVVVDYMGAVDIVRDMVTKARKRTGMEISHASTSFPPGTDPRLSTNILEAAWLEVTAVRDEPSCVAELLRLDEAAVVDIGGGTTGTAVVHDGRVVFSADEPTGGRHLSLVLAGHYGVDFEEAERIKREPEAHDVLNLVRPTLQRIGDIVAGHIRGHQVGRIILSGGTCCLPGAAGVLEAELGLPVTLPSQPLLLTPLAIASLQTAPAGRPDTRKTTRG
ncbi:ethanolamine utilization protein EutJ [Fundidesulfovibrio agrisoli]|uniref:ethanolamine utilization protein EutJ n=1 Tax=Fundidesulfovibrio agrisoli TaxID=2922717 RepID=UPI001FAC4198|nr:ethanolamine utilization protein EutJ [Fundidesulfovibrio agrisoli]